MSQRKIKKLRKQVVSQEVGVAEIGSPEFVGFMQILRENWKFLAVLLVGICLLYLNAMRGDFVSDDYATISQNSRVADFRYSLATTPNLVNMSNTIIAYFFGVKSPVPFHIWSLIIYLADCVLVFVFVYLLFGRSVAIFTTIIFAVHPLHVEGVSWVSGKPYTLSAFFVMATLISLKLFLELGERRRLLVTMLMLLLAYFSEGARSLTIFALTPLIFIYTGGKKNQIDLKKVVVVALAISLTILIIIWPKIINRINVVNSGVNVSESIFYNPLFQYPTAVTKYLQLLLAPVDLTLYHTMYVFPAWLNWTVFLLYLGAVIYFFFRDKRIFFALSFIFMSSVSSMAPVKVAWLVAERYMFLGSMGLCLLLAIILEGGMKRGYKATAMTVLGLIAVGFSFRTYLRNIDWQTNHKLWVNTCQVSPNSHNAWNNIGDDYDKLKDYGNAIKGFSQSTIVKPNYADAYHNRANILFKIGRLDLARESYTTALYFSPGLMQSYLSLTQIDLLEKRLDLALNHAQRAVELAPGTTQPLYVLAVVKAQAGYRDEAIDILKTVLKYDPNFNLARDMLLQLGSIMGES